jgi:hypothetical protein
VDRATAVEAWLAREERFEVQLRVSTAILDNALWQKVVAHLIAGREDDRVDLFRRSIAEVHD